MRRQLISTTQLVNCRIVLLKQNDMKSKNPKPEVNLAPMQAVITRMITDLTPHDLQPRKARAKMDLQRGLDQSALVFILIDLVDAVIERADSGSVHISAQKHLDLMLLHITHSGPYNFKAVSDKLSHVQPLAEKMNGYIGVTTYLNGTTTIAFSFTTITA
jgi:hypothetical protein